MSAVTPPNLTEDDTNAIAAALRLAIAKLDADYAIADLIYDKDRMSDLENAKRRFEAALDKFS